jgi:hypothetical protein
MSSFQTLMEEDFGVALELICLASNIKKEICGVLDSLFSFLKRFNERKTHNVLVLMLDTKFKSLRLVSSSIGRDQGVIIVVEQYDTMSLYPMLMKCYYQLHPLMVLLIIEWMMIIVWIFSNDNREY